MKVKVFYKLSELAQRWEKTEIDILHMAAAGDLMLSFWHDGLVMYDATGSKTTTVAGVQTTLLESKFGISTQRFKGLLNVRVDELMLLISCGGPVDDWSVEGELNAITQDGRGLLCASRAEISISTLLIMAEEAARYETKRPELAEWQLYHEEQKPKNDILFPVKCGARKKPLREAVEHLYDKFQEEGNTEILQSGKIQEFIERLRDSTIEGNRNFSEYVAERIKNVKKTSGKWIITTQEIKKRGCNYLESEPKGQNDISKILLELRKIKPLAT